MNPFAFSSSPSASSVPIVTSPRSNRTLQLPQVPERQALSISTPQSSAPSKIDFAPVHSMDLPAREKVTLNLGASDTSASVFGIRLAVPKASSLRFSLATPSSSIAAFVASIIGTGPQMCTRRDWISGTQAAMNCLSMRPTRPGHGSSPGRLIATWMCKLSCFSESPSISFAKMKSLGVRKPRRK